MHGVFRNVLDVLMVCMYTVPVTPPPMNHTNYYNRKGWYSMLVQVVVDHNCFLRDISLGWPGSVHNARVLANSSLYRNVNNGELLEGELL